MLAKMVSVFCVRSKVRGYRIYQSIWPNPFVGEEVSFEREAGNSHDPQAVAMTKLINGNVEVVGHVPGQYLLYAVCLSGEEEVLLAKLL